VAHGVRALFIDLRRIDAAHVIGLEDLGLEHGADANGEALREAARQLIRFYT
jgi:hypothetical protein